MHTARFYHTGGLPDREHPGQRPLSTETPLDRDPRTETPLDRDPSEQRPPVNRITDMCKVITFQQLRLRAVKTVPVRGADLHR